jgi:hypothetical protein
MKMTKNMLFEHYVQYTLYVLRTLHNYTHTEYGVILLV